MSDDPTMSEAKPQSWFYGPDGQAGVFEECPEGWEDHPGKVKGAPDPSLETAVRRPGRAEMMKELEGLGVKPNPAAGGAELFKQLQDARAAIEPFDHDGDGKPGGAPKGGNRRRGKA